MDKSKVAFEIIRTDGKVSGFSLMGFGQTEAESFCYSFPSALGEGQAKVVIKINDKKIVFTHSGYYQKDAKNVLLNSGPGKYEAPLNEADAVALKQLLNGEGSYEKCKLRCKPLHAWGHGFELRAE